MCRRPGTTRWLAGRVSHGRVIVEGFIDFDYEITQLDRARPRRRRPRSQTHFCDPIGHVQVSGDYVESWQPHRDGNRWRCRSSRDIAKAVTDDLGLGLDGKPAGLGLFGVELFVKGDDVWFSEVSPRPHDTGMVTLATQWQNEFELHARAILGLPVDTSPEEPWRQCGDLWRRGRAGHRVRWGRPRACACRAPKLRLFGKPESFAKRRMGVALVHDADVEVARRQAKLAASRVKPRAA